MPQVLGSIRWCFMDGSISEPLFQPYIRRQNLTHYLMPVLFSFFLFYSRNRRADTGIILFICNIKNKTDSNNLSFFITCNYCTVINILFATVLYNKLHQTEMIYDYNNIWNASIIDMRHIYRYTVKRKIGKYLVLCR